MSRGCTTVVISFLILASLRGRLAIANLNPKTNNASIALRCVR
jgi:hypothetical protein